MNHKMTIKFAALTFLSVTIPTIPANKGLKGLMNYGNVKINSLSKIKLKAIRKGGTDRCSEVN